MEGRKHSGLVWIEPGEGPGRPHAAPSAAEWRSAAGAIGGVVAVSQFRIAEGFALAGGGRELVLLETTGPPASDVAFALRPAPGPLSTAVAPFAAYRRVSSIGDVSSPATNGIVAVLTDCSAPEREGEFHAWYEHHARDVIEHMDHHSVTRYVNEAASSPLARHLAIYETSSHDPGLVQREGMAWYFGEEHAADHPTIDCLVLRGEIALERADREPSW